MVVPRFGAQCLAAGHGFLAQEGGKDVFFQAGDVTGPACKSLAEGTTVRFDVREGPKGLQATNVAVVSRSER